ncbi:hypothetical protein [Flavobacterium sp.]|uniref:hypothetical protein n=1 Tax=Flavobacterium sp. TaxID=239 RepID=UPI002D0AC709|nr:hypothetical protein [Flavobacterium sp.]HSD07651.1 hypothetical protein [Flavobacterium sp.]
MKTSFNYPEEDKNSSVLITAPTFNAQATIGLIKGYSNELISFSDFKMVLLTAQKQIKKEFELVLSTKITLCEIVCLGQEEPSVSLDFIQYPKFQIEEAVLRKAIIRLIEILMELLQQNRVVIVFPDNTIMLEQSETIDPNITL